MKDWRFYLPILVVGILLVFFQNFTATSTESARISTRIVNGQGVFWDNRTGVQFYPRGVNYVRLYDSEKFETFEPSKYSATDVNTALSEMKYSGYNYVRVFLECDFLRSGFGLGNTPGIPTVYLKNVADFIERAKYHGLHVILTGLYIPPNYESILYATPQIENVTDVNEMILSPGYAKAQAQFFTDLLVGLENVSPTILASVLAIDIFNEATVTTSAAPFSNLSGQVVRSGVTYKMSEGYDRQRLIDVASVEWINTIVDAIKAVDPEILVGASLYSPLTVGHTGYNSAVPVPVAKPQIEQLVYPLRPKVLAAYSKVDYIDIHAYPAPSYSLEVELNAAEISQGEIWQKPLIMGEYGAYKGWYGNLDEAVVAIKNLLHKSCAFGFTGWGLWTWNTTEQMHNGHSYWTAKESGGAINGVLAPSVNPISTICSPIAQGVFRVHETIYYSNGKDAYCQFDSMENFKKLMGMTDLKMVSFQHRPPGAMRFDGICR